MSGRSNVNDEQYERHRCGAFDDARSSDTEQTDDHSIIGTCPWGHSLIGDCYCVCRKCRNVRNRPKRLRELHESRYIEGPKRIKFSPSPDAGPDGDQRCMERTPWLKLRLDWARRCKHTRERQYTDEGDILPRRYQGAIKTCKEARCVESNVADPPYKYYNDIETLIANNPRWVCEHHIADAKSFWEIPSLYASHLVQPCLHHERLLTLTYPNGLNTCTCPNLFNRWQCRACLEAKVRKLQNHFRRRVLVVRDFEEIEDIEGDDVYNRYAGLADKEMVSSVGYHLNWREVRKMLARDHPCQHACGRRRLQRPSAVMDCRACGGMIIKPPPALRATRTREQARLRGNAPLWELDRSGKPVRVGGEVRDGPENEAVDANGVPTVGRGDDEDRLETENPTKPFEIFTEDEEEEEYKYEYYADNYDEEKDSDEED